MSTQYLDAQIKLSPPLPQAGCELFCCCCGCRCRWLCVWALSDAILFMPIPLPELTVLFPMPTLGGGAMLKEPLLDCLRGGGAMLNDENGLL